MEVDQLAALPPEEAIPQLVEAYGGMLFTLGRRLCGSTEEAEDLVQETFLQAFRDWGQFEGRAKAKTWLFTIAARTCQRLQRRRVGQPRHLASVESLLPFGQEAIGVAPEASPLDQQLRKEGIERLEVAIASLPLDFRVPLVLRDILEFSVAEVAQMTGLKEATVKTRVHRARLRLRQALETVLPKERLAPPAYSRQMCLDLLRLKQEALDRGVASTPQLDAVVCDRCQAVFNSLDLAQELCQELRQGRLPAQLKSDILKSVETQAHP